MRRAARFPEVGVLRIRARDTSNDSKGWTTMRLPHLIQAICIVAAFSAGAARAAQLPEPLIFQIQHLAKAYGDDRAFEDIEGRMIQRLGAGPEGERVLTVFGVNGFRTARRTMQYLALFVESESGGGEKGYRLIDAVPIGGQGWREIMDLDAKVKNGARPGDLAITLRAADRTRVADANAPVKMTTIQLMFKDGRFVESTKRIEPVASSRKPVPAAVKR